MPPERQAVRKGAERPARESLAEGSLGAGRVNASREGVVSFPDLSPLQDRVLERRL